MNPLKKIIRNVCFVLCCLVIVWLIAQYRFEQTAPGGALYLPDYSAVTGQSGPLSVQQRWSMALADGLMAVGVVVASVGAMSWIATTGLFDTLGYAANVLWNRLTFRSSQQSRFYDYKVAKAEARSKSRPTRFIFAVGAVLLLLSILCTLAFYRI